MMTQTSFPVSVRIFDRGKLVCEKQVWNRAEFGRQNEDETAQALYTVTPRGRLILADIKETDISRVHVVVEVLSSDRVRLTNQSRGFLHLEGVPRLEQGASREIDLPIEMLIGTRRVQLAQPMAPRAEFAREDSSLHMARNLDLARSYAADASTRAEGGTLDNESLVKWIQAILGVLQGAATTEEFLPRAARALVDLIRLDSGRVLGRRGERWEELAVQTAAPVRNPGEWQPSRAVVNQVLRDRTTCCLGTGSVPSAAVSLAEVQAVVAAPILDAAGEVSGMLYGERRIGPMARRGISRLEVMLVELLASGIAVGQARLEQEKKALRAQVQMEQFFTPELARYLHDHPEALEGRDVEVTMLSCDIRGFSRICERLQLRPAETLAWLNHVLGELSDCVLAEQGVLVDYVGDEVMTMWGAPEAQADHAQRACRAALAMLALVPRLNERWQATVQEAIGVRIGINSGQARVGNVGSGVKFKYGALGNTINLASRVQGAAKYFRTSLLLTETTQQHLDASFATRRLAQVRVINIARPVTLYEVMPPDQPGAAELRAAYEEALTAFETGEFRAAARVLGGLLTQPRYRDDGPSLILMQRAVTALVDEPDEFSPVWELPSK